MRRHCVPQQRPMWGRRLRKALTWLTGLSPRHIWHRKGKANQKIFLGYLHVSKLFLCDTILQRSGVDENVENKKVLATRCVISHVVFGFEISLISLNDRANGYIQAASGGYYVGSLLAISLIQRFRKRWHVWAAGAKVDSVCIHRSGWGCDYLSVCSFPLRWWFFLHFRAIPAFRLLWYSLEYLIFDFLSDFSWWILSEMFTLSATACVGTNALAIPMLGMPKTPRGIVVFTCVGYS